MVKQRRAAPGYEILGNIAIVDLEGIAGAKGGGIASRILREHKSVRTVLAKSGPVSGRFRIRKLRYLKGRRSYTADYRENGCRFVFDVRKAFFSGRLSFERNRIASMSKGKENVIVMFAGVGPYAIEIAKRNPEARVVAMELNNDAYAAMCGNIMINKAKNVTAVLGDVRKVAERYRNFADRVVMPLPKDSIEFLSDAVDCCKRKAVIHIYMLADSSTPENAVRVLRDHARSRGYRIRSAKWRVARNYSPKEVEIAVDLNISR